MVWGREVRSAVDWVERLTVGEDGMRMKVDGGEDEEDEGGLTRTTKTDHQGALPGAIGLVEAA
jgi:hypothetical protein